MSFNPDGIRVHSSVEVLQYRNRKSYTYQLLVKTLDSVFVNHFRTLKQ